MRVAGHGLQREGRAHDAAGRYTGDATGYALCSCGWMSEWCGTDAQRKRYHVEHKEQVLRERSGA